MPNMKQITTYIFILDIIVVLKLRFDQSNQGILKHECIRQESPFLRIGLPRRQCRKVRISEVRVPHLRLWGNLKDLQNLPVKKGRKK